MPGGRPAARAASSAHSREQPRRARVAGVGLADHRIAGGDGRDEVAARDRVEREGKVVGTEHHDRTAERAVHERMLALVSMVACAPRPLARGRRALAQLVGGARQLDVAQARRLRQRRSPATRARPARRRAPRCAPRSPRGSARSSRGGIDTQRGDRLLRGADGQQSRRRGSTPDSVAGSGVLVDGFDGLERIRRDSWPARHSPAIRTGSSDKAISLVKFDPARTSHAPATRFSSVSAPMVMVTMSPGDMEKSCGGTMPVPVIRNAPRGKSSSLARYSTSSSSGRLICAVRVSPWNADAPAARDRQLDRQVLQALDVAEQDARAERARAVVDLGLRQVERVLALDVARGHVVADAEADDLAGGVHHQRQLGLGHVPGAVGAHADRLLVADDAPADRPSRTARAASASYTRA